VWLPSKWKSECWISRATSERAIASSYKIQENAVAADELDNVADCLAFQTVPESGIDNTTPVSQV
jgi:hypothetical protein